MNHSLSPEQRLTKAHIKLMKHPDTVLYGSVIVMGKSVIDDNVPTACTDGYNKMYGREFVKDLTDAELRGLIMHENLHVALQHMLRFKSLFKKEPQLLNMAADYVVNDVIMQFEDKDFAVLPKGGLWDKKYRNWSVMEVYRDLKQQRDNDPDWQPQDSFDEHIITDESEDNGKSNGNSSNSESGSGNPRPSDKELIQQVEEALRQGKILAGQMGGKVARQIDDLLVGRVNWKEIMRDFVVNLLKGADDWSFKKYNKKHIMDELYLPTTISENVGEIVVAIDTSGSIYGLPLAQFCTELKLICELLNPEKVTVLWWDSKIARVQVFRVGEYNDIENMLKPSGGGGTEPNCVSEYVKENNIQASAMIVFTDGYFYTDDIKWDVPMETLWLVTENENLKVPSGRVVKQYLD